MKNIILQVVLFFAVTVNVFAATTYYIDADYGDDNWDGLHSTYQQSNNGPWKTIAKVNSYTLSPGDTVLLKRGNIWREKLVLQSGSSSGYIKYGSYGYGAKPQIRRSISANNESQWINISGNIWELDAEFPVYSDVAFISFNNDSIIGVKVWNEVDIDEQNEFWTDESNNNRTRVYSIANPALFYSNIEVVIHEEGIRGLNNTAYVILEGLHVRYCGWSGIELSDRSHDIIISNCDVSYIGGGHQNGTGEIRNGNGINTQIRAHDITIEGCRIWECYDAGIALQGYWSGGLEVYNIYIHHNEIRNCEYSFELWGKYANSYIHDIFFENNTATYAGYGWSHTQRPDPQGTHIQNWMFNGDIDNINIRNNIFYEAQKALVKTVTRDSIKAELSYNNNIFYKTSGDEGNYAWIWRHNNIEYNYLLSEYNDWISDTNWDTNSFFTDPLLINVNTGNFRLTDNSPCKNSGADTGYAWDITSTYLCRESAYDIGAYEYINWRCTENFFRDSFDNENRYQSDYTENFWNYIKQIAGKNEVKEENGFLIFHSYGTDSAANLHSFIRRTLNSDLNFFTKPVTINITGLNIETENMDSNKAYVWIFLPSETKDSYNCDDALRIEIKGDMSYSLAKKVNNSLSGAYTTICSGYLESLPVDIYFSVDATRYFINFITSEGIVSSSGTHGINASDWNSGGSALYLQTKRESVTGDMKISIDNISAVKLLVDNFDNDIPEDSDHEEDFWYRMADSNSNSIVEEDGFIKLKNFGPNTAINMLRSPLIPDLNFYNSTILVTVDGISMTGTADSNKRRLFVSILSEVNSSYSADDKFRVDIYGDGTVNLYIKANGPGNTLIYTDILLAVPHKLVFRIDKQHYDITFFYNNTTKTFSGDHGIAIEDWGPANTPVTGDGCLLIESKREDTSGNTSEVKIDQISFSREFK